MHGLPRARQIHSGERRAQQLSLQPGYSGQDGAECEAGTFKEAAGAAPCVACGAGKYLTTTGATTAAACVLCGAAPLSSGACLRVNFGSFLLQNGKDRGLSAGPRRNF